MAIRTRGLDGLRKKLDKLARNAKALDGEHSIPMTELLNPNFMQRCSSFATAEEFFTAGGFDTLNSAAFDAIPESALDAHVVSTTRFQTWNEMKRAAAAEWAKKQLMR